MKKTALFLLWMLITCLVLSAAAIQQKTANPPLTSLKIEPPMPDLVISNCRFEKQNANTTAFVTLLNSGNGGAVFSMGHTMAELTILGKTYKCAAPAGGYYIGAQQSAELTQVFPSPVPGTYPATWVANPNQAVSEKNSGNNSANCQLVIAASQGPLPDLVITGFSVQPASGPPSTVFSIVITITNQGDAMAPGGVWMHCNLTMDDAGYGFVRCGSDPPDIDLAPGQSWTYSRCTSNPLAPGLHRVGGKVDVNNRIGEKNENNNTNSCTFTVTQ